MIFPPPSWSVESAGKSFTPSVSAKSEGVNSIEDSQQIFCNEIFFFSFHMFTCPLIYIYIYICLLCKAINFSVSPYVKL